MLRKVILCRLYNSITQHNRSLLDYSKGESESKGIYLIYRINRTTTCHSILVSVSSIFNSWKIRPSPGVTAPSLLMLISLLNLGAHLLKENLANLYDWVGPPLHLDFIQLIINFIPSCEP